MSLRLEGLMLQARRMAPAGGSTDADDVRIGPFDLEVAAGERVLVVGPTGTCKSLLLAALAGLRPSCVVAGRAVVPRPIGFVPPRDGLLADLSVLDNVLIGHDAGPTTARARIVLHALGLGGVADRRPPSLSGGQRRRVALARALATAPHTLLLDDPTAGLDPATTREVLAVVEAMAPEAAVLVASPDVDVMAGWCGRALWLGSRVPRLTSCSALPAPWTPRATPEAA